MSVGERIERRLTELDISQSELARRVELSQTTINSIIRKGGGTKHLHAIARALQTTPAYLASETDDPSEGALPAPTSQSIAEQLDSVLVPLYNLNFGMGDGSFFFDDSLSVEQIPFKKNWLRSHIEGRLDQVMMVYGRGDSMEPTIRDGDVLLIDRSQTMLQDPDLIWAFGYGELGMIKRLRRMPRGGYLVQSDNRVVKDFKAADDEIHMVGRVVSILRWQ